MTSIEWLIKKITNEIMNEEYIDKLSIEKTNLSRNYVKQAKEMHKQEIIKAHNQSWHDRYNAYKTAENYYQETFVSKGSDETSSQTSHFIDNN
jgi:vacuolar-type H+-ATPase subunit H